MTNINFSQISLPKISTHTLTWSVTRSAGVHGKPAEYFNSHAHVERDDGIQARYDEVYHFNSHAHVERDLYADKLSSYWQISTHTLTWSVTIQTFNSTVVGHISTHTLTWSVTDPITITVDMGENFNSHAHVERDNNK